MGLGRSAISWTGKHILAVVLITAILVLGRIAWKPVCAWAETQIEQARSVPQMRATFADSGADFEDYANTRLVEVRKASAELASMPEQALHARLLDIQPEIEKKKKGLLSSSGLALAAATGKSDQVLAHYKAGLEIRFLERERNFIGSALSAQRVTTERETLKWQRAAAAERQRNSYKAWNQARSAQLRLNDVELVDTRNYICANNPTGIGCARYREYVSAQDEEARALDKNKAARRDIAKIDRTLGSLRNVRAVAGDAMDIVRERRAALRAKAAEIDAAAKRNWIIWIKGPVGETLPIAIGIVLAAILSPILIKCVLYFLVAPFASRRRPITLFPSDQGAVASKPPLSAVSQRVQLESGEELLVLPDFLQSSPHAAPSATKWLLSWRMPFSSLASGMYGLTRFRASQPDYASISATRDPLAETGLIILPQGSAMVLQPRSLLGVVQSIAAPMRITKHWRVGHLSSWLTLRFRYLVFHGPCTLIVQGTRGVCLESVGSGRSINQAATLGFSAGAAYSVRRCETFGAYLMGKQALFNDSFGGGKGFYLYEEMPREGKRSGIWGRGVEGLGDAVLKVFGL